MKSKIEAWIKRLIAEVVKAERVTKADADSFVVYAAGRAAEDVRKAAERIHEEKIAALTAGHEEIFKIKGDLISEIQKLHAAFERAEDRLHSKVGTVAHAVANADRRVCTDCKRLAHDFEIIAGKVICRDCKAKQEDR